MPVVNITLIKGYSADARRRLSTNMTNLVTQFLGAVSEGTTVMVSELDQASYMRGHENKNPPPPPSPAASLVQDYLNAMQARDLQAAGAFLDDAFWMEFPGGVRMQTLEELIAWSKPRYIAVLTRCLMVSARPLLRPRLLLSATAPCMVYGPMARLLRV